MTLEQDTKLREYARVGISAQGFWVDKRHLAFFTVRVLKPHAPSCSNPSLASTYRRHEKEIQVAWSPAATVTYRRIASLLAEQRAQPYSRTIAWLAPVCPQLLPDPISHPVHLWCTLCQTQAIQTVHGLLSCARGRGRQNPQSLIELMPTTILIPLFHSLFRLLKSMCMCL